MHLLLILHILCIFHSVPTFNTLNFLFQYQYNLPLIHHIESSPRNSFVSIYGLNFLPVNSCQLSEVRLLVLLHLHVVLVFVMLVSCFLTRFLLVICLHLGLILDQLYFQVIFHTQPVYSFHLLAQNTNHIEVNTCSSRSWLLYLFFRRTQLRKLLLSLTSYFSYLLQLQTK